jgi:hypothetical protein
MMMSDDYALCDSPGHFIQAGLLSQAGVLRFPGGLSVLLEGHAGIFKEVFQ